MGIVSLPMELPTNDSNNFITLVRVECRGRKSRNGKILSYSEEKFSKFPIKVMTKASEADLSESLRKRDFHMKMIDYECSYAYESS